MDLTRGLHLAIKTEFNCVQTIQTFSSPAKESAGITFLKNILPNTFLALATVPAESLAVRRILFLLENHSASLRRPLTFVGKVKHLHDSHTHTIRQIGLRKLFTGSSSRVSYCLARSLVTLQGMEHFGSDSRGLFFTALVKNLTLPLSLFATVRQSGLSLLNTYRFVTKSAVDPVVHASFFMRNLLTNGCLLSGFLARDYCDEVIGKSDSIIPTSLGITVSCVTSTCLNAFLKPFFTGKYPTKACLATACRLPALAPLAFREIAFIAFIFASSAPRHL